MYVHPLIHGELARQRRLELERSGARLRPAAGELTSLVRAARKGDPSAWESLVNRFTPTLRAVVRSYRLGAADSEDVVQATWAAAVVHLDRVREPEAVGGWLAVTARREALRTLERRRREVAVDEPCAPGASEPDAPERALVEAQERDAVHAAVERLPGHQRRLLRTLLRQPDTSYVELSERLRLPIGSIGPTRLRALATLRRDRRLADLVSTGRGG
jgi:RNA polymerase sigma factor (sigma-70 family)